MPLAEIAVSKCGRSIRNQRSIWLRTAAAVMLIALLTHAAGQNSGRFAGQVVDDGTGRPLATAVAVTNSEGQSVEIAGKHDHVQFLRKRWCYVDGRFEVLREGQALNVEIRRGLETLPVKEAIQEGVNDRTFRMRRWIDMPRLGYMNGDTHVHYLSLPQSHLQMRAEDLQVLNLLTSDFTNDAQKFTGAMDAVSTPESWVWVGQEFRDWQQGHINLLRLRKIVEPLGPFGGTFRKMSERHLLLAPAARAARQQNAAVTWAHFGDMPGTESPIDIALGLIDAVDMITQRDPMRTGLHWEPWRMERPAHLPPLEALSGIDLYYRYLNSGFRLPLAAGSDKMADDIPVGSGRLYVKTGGNRTFDAWIDGLKAGNGFITNGPMLTFEVDGHAPGKVVQIKGSRSVTARTTAKSIYEFRHLQIVMNGEVVASSSEPKRNASGIYEAELTARVALDSSAWLAARVAEPYDQQRAILPRRISVFAHSNPVYFLRDSKKVRVQDSIDYLTLYLRYTDHWFRTGAKFENGLKQQEAIRSAGTALDFYRAL